MQKITSH
jgi:hypothetical protein